MADASSVVDGGDGGGQAAVNWAEGLDADTKGWVSGKGWDKLPQEQAFGEAIKGYRGAEKTLGVPAEQIIKLPGKDAKPEDWRPVWQRLGAPENPDGYELKAPEGQSGEFLKTASGWFHELGIPKPMAAGLATKWNEYVQAAQVADEGKWNQRFEQEIGELKGEWKADYEKNLDLSRRVMKATGWTNEQLQAMERALGPKAFLAGFAKFGGAVGEHRFVGGEGQGGFQMSPETAKARIADLQKDTTWRAAFLQGDADKKAEWTRLHQIAYPEQQQAA